MLTIPANMQTALKKNPNQEFRYIIKIGRSLVASPYTASNFYISSNATFGTNNVGITDSIVYPVVPILLKEPDITEQLDLRAHTSTVGGFSIELDDNFLFQNPAHSNALEKFSDQLNTYNIYNRDLYIYLWLPGLTNLQTECLEMYHGIVGDVKISGDKIVIPISNSTFKVQRELPQKIINVTDHPLAPSESIGLPYSLVYGQHKYLYCNPNKSLATSVELNNLIPCRYVGLDANNNHRWVISSNKCKSINALWIYDTQLAKYTQLLSGWVIEFNNEVDGAIVRINNDPVYTDYHLSNGNVVATISGSIAEEREANIETSITVSDEVIEEHELDVETEITVSDSIAEEREANIEINIETSIIISDEVVKEREANIDVETAITVSDSIAEEREANIETPITISDEIAAKILDVTAPNGGEVWLYDENHDITWNYMSGIANVKIEYSVDNGANWSPVINSTPCDGTYNWLIPNKNSNQCLIKISDADDAAIFDISDAVFIIAT